MKNKKFYWMKMETDFYYRHDIKYFLSSNKGLNIVIVYQMLMLESISHEGRLRFNKEKPYTIEMLHNIFFTAFNDLETTKECFKALEDMDLIKWEKDKTLHIKGVEERIGSTTEQALYMQEYRAKKDNEELQESLQCKPPVRNCKKNVITNVSLDIEKDIEIDKELDIERDNNACVREEEQIENLKQLIHSIEEMFNRCLTNAETITIQEFSRTMSNESIIRDLKTYSDKTNPIAYMKKALENAKIQEQVKPKQEEQEQKTYEINCWLDAFNILHDEEAPQYMKDKAKEYMNKSKRGG